MTIKNLPSYPFFPPFLRDSAGVLGGEGERLLFLPVELALRSLRSGVREDWSDKPRAAQGARDGGWEKEQQNERMERLHTQGGEALGERRQEGGGGCRGGGGDDQGSCTLSLIKIVCLSPWPSLPDLCTAGESFIWHKLSLSDRSLPKCSKLFWLNIVVFSQMLLKQPLIQTGCWFARPTLSGSFKTVAVPVSLMLVEHMKVFSMRCQWQGQNKNIWSFSKAVAHSKPKSVFEFCRVVFCKVADKY